MDIVKGKLKSFGKTVHSELVIPFVGDDSSHSNHG